ncbi:MAG: hypothetical protein WEC39_02425, partial [Patescibacteria group bacterium]
MANSKLSRATDLHPFHFTGSFPAGGDLDASFTAKEITGWVQRFSVFNRFVLGTHSPNFFRIKTRLEPLDYLHHVRANAEAAAQGFKGKVFFGLECDFIVKKGRIGFNPAPALITEFNPDISIVGFHFHDTLTYGGIYDLAIRDLTKALEEAIDSGLFAAIAHPFEVLERLWAEDPSSFEKVANLAKERKVAFEINADKGFYEASFKRLMGNGNLFSFGSDLHSLSHWLKREWEGLKVPDRDLFLMERVLGLSNEAADLEKAAWREMDYLFREVKLSGPVRHDLRNQATSLYKSSLPLEVFDRRLKKIIAHFGKLEATIVERHLREMDSVYRRWGGQISYEDRMLAEKYFLEA